MRLTSLSGAVRSREASQKLKMFSKEWEPGTTLRTFYKTYIDPETGRRELLAGSCMGHKVNDMKALGLKTTFIPSLCEYDEETGKPIGNPDILYQFARLAPYFIKGQHQRREDELQSKNYPQEALRREALRQLDDEYDTKNNLKAIKPVIGNASPLITVEVLCVPYKDGKPNFDVPDIACQPISNKVAKRLDAILQDKRFAPVDPDGYLEVEWAFPMDNKKSESGKNVVPTGISPEYSMANQFPEEFEKVKGRFADLASDSDMVRRRATSGVKESVIKQALTTYSFKYSSDLEYCVHNEELLSGALNCISVIKELDIDRAITEPVFTERINEALALTAEEEAPVPIETPKEAPKQAPTLENLLAQQEHKVATGSAEDMSDAMDDIDLSAFGASNE